MTLAFKLKIYTQNIFKMLIKPKPDLTLNTLLTCFRLHTRVSRRNIDNILLTADNRTAIFCILSYYKKKHQSKNLVVYLSNITCKAVVETVSSLCSKVILYDHRDSVLYLCGPLDFTVIIVNNILSFGNYQRIVDGVPKSIPIIVDKAHSIPAFDEVSISASRDIYYVYSLYKVSCMNSGGLIQASPKCISNLKAYISLKPHYIIDEIIHFILCLIKVICKQVIPPPLELKFTKAQLELNGYANESEKFEVDIEKKLVTYKMFALDEIIFRHLDWKLLAKKRTANALKLESTILKTYPNIKFDFACVGYGIPLLVSEIQAAISLGLKYGFLLEPTLKIIKKCGVSKYESNLIPFVTLPCNENVDVNQLKKCIREISKVNHCESLIDRSLYSILDC